MPIQPYIQLRAITDMEFSELDAVVMRCAYASQNYFGRQFDERVYENDIAQRLRAEGLNVQTEVPISVTHAGYEKIYFVDLIVEAMLYELKVVDYLVGEHSAQALNYAMLHDVRLVKLINLGDKQVQGKLLCNALSKRDRYQAIEDLSGWRPVDESCSRLLNCAKALLQDWGTLLDCQLYNSALVHLFGGDATCAGRVELYADNVYLGSHSVQMYGTKRAFFVTGFNRSAANYQRHLEVLLQHAPELELIQWLNFNRACLEAKTIAASR